MSQTERIREIIEAARKHSAGAIFLDTVVRSRLGADASEADAESAVAFCREILDAVPVLLDRVREAAEEHGVAYFIEPMLTHAENYFVNPTDHLSEILFGERGLLDDAYLALSIIQLVTTGSHPLIRIELDPPLRFLEQLNPDACCPSCRRKRARRWRRCWRRCSGSARRRSRRPNNGGASRASRGGR